MRRAGGMITILRGLFSQQKSSLLPEADEISEEQQDPDVAKQTAAITEPGPVQMMAIGDDPDPCGKIGAGSFPVPRMTGGEGGYNTVIVR